MAKALGSGRRAEIVDLLAQGERSVEEIAGEISQSVANTSQHLHVLAKAGLVRTRREGTRVYYRLASDRVGDLWAAVRELAVRHVAEVSVLAPQWERQRYLLRSRVQQADAKYDDILRRATARSSSAQARLGSAGLVVVVAFALAIVRGRDRRRRR